MWKILRIFAVKNFFTEYMSPMKISLLNILFLFFAFSALRAQNTKTFTLSGTISDSTSGETLAGATIFVKEKQNGAASNNYGFYSLSLPKGSYTLIFNYVGYRKKLKKINLTKDIRLNIELNPTARRLEEVEIKANAANDNLRSAEMSVVKMDIKTVNRIPALLGEVDILKTIQLLPGVISGGDGSTGYSVRGGGTDQNLILMDEAPVYNASHLMGFFSVFNNDAIKDLKLYKGDIPAAYGGRISSLLDIHQKEGNNKKFGVRGGLGLISSRLMAEGPLVKNKASFLVAARRSYVDIFLPLSPKEEVRHNTMYFYDINFKVNAEINENNRFFVSGYFGRDVFGMKHNYGNSNFGMDYGNNTFTLRWNHIFSKKLFSNFTLLRSNYSYKLSSDDATRNFTWNSRMTSYSFKNDYGYFLNPSNTIKFGVSADFHYFYPGEISALNDNSALNDFKVPESQALESGIYIENKQKIGGPLSLDYGLRFGVLSNVGPATVFNFDDKHNYIDSNVYAAGDFYNNYMGLEPRFSMIYMLTDMSSLKASYSRTMQFVQLASNSTVGNPLSIWFPASPNVKPQYADQVAAGFFHNFKSGIIETSVELFYKKMYSQIDFKDHAQLLMNEKLEGELRFGTGRAYGIEFFVRKNSGKLTGWISYTLSRSMRYFEMINDGKPYLSPFDKPNDLSLVLSYDFTPRLNVSATWVYTSGATATFPSGRFVYGNVVAPVYTDRNAYRLPDYHRLDLGITLKEKHKEGRKWHHSWVFSVYNAYNRHNAFSIDFKPSKEDPNKTVAVKTYLFGIIPSITFNFDF